jgi:hypothetical protein
MKRLLFTLLLSGIGSVFAQTVNENGTEVDFRIYADHTQAQVTELVKNNPLEIKRLNYYYQNSYLIILSNTEGAKFDVNTVNVKRFEDQRLENERKTIIVSANNDKLVLKSKKEMEQEYLQIK